MSISQQPYDRSSNPFAQSGLTVFHRQPLGLQKNRGGKNFVDYGNVEKNMIFYFFLTG